MNRALCEGSKRGCSGGRRGGWHTVAKARAWEWRAAVLSCLLLVGGCGGEDGGGPREGGRLDVAEVTSSIDFGSMAVPTDLGQFTVRTAAGAASVEPAGRAGTLIFASGPQYAELLDDAGRAVMLAFVSPEDSGFSAASTARAVAYLALAGPWMKEQGRLQLLAEVDDLPGYPLLRDSIQAGIAEAGYLDLSAPAIQSAVATLVQAAYAPTANAIAKSFAMAKPMGVIATPTSASGLSLDTTVDSRLTIQNVHLRRVSLFFRRAAHVDAAGVEVAENNAFTRADMDMVGRYGGITGTLDGYFKGEVAYSPVSTTLDIPRYPGDARRTTYEIFAIGPGGASDGGLVVPADILAEQQLLEVKALFLDAFLVLLANVALPLKGDQIDAYLQFASANAVVTDIIGTLRGTVPAVWDQLANGDYYGALKTLFNSAYTSNTILPAIGQLTLDFLWENTGINEDDYEMLLGGMKGLLDKMGRIDIGFTLADTFLLFRDTAVSSKVERFVVDTTPGKVTLVAAASSLTIDQTTTIDAVIQDKDAAGVYEYRWSVYPAASYWVEDRHLAGSDDAAGGILVTAESRVNIRSLSMSEGTAQVRAEVFRLDGGRRQVGEGTVAITFDRTNRVQVSLVDFGTAVATYQQPNGRFTGVLGIYVDLPRSVGANDYLFTRLREGTVNEWGTSANEPVTKNEYFEYSDSRPSAQAQAALAGQVPGFSIRMWLDVKQYTEQRTEALARQVAEGFIPSSLNHARTRPVTLITTYP